MPAVSTSNFMGLSTASFISFPSFGPVASSLAHFFEEPEELTQSNWENVGEVLDEDSRAYLNDLMHSLPGT